jgi:hypothetical protein
VVVLTVAAVKKIGREVDTANAYEASSCFIKAKISVSECISSTLGFLILVLMGFIGPKCK